MLTWPTHRFSGEESFATGPFATGYYIFGSISIWESIFPLFWFRPGSSSIYFPLFRFVSGQILFAILPSDCFHNFQAVNSVASLCCVFLVMFLDWFFFIRFCDLSVCIKHYISDHWIPASASQRVLHACHHLLSSVVLYLLSAVRYLLFVQFIVHCTALFVVYIYHFYWPVWLLPTCLLLVSFCAKCYRTVQIWLEFWLLNADSKLCSVYLDNMMVVFARA